MDILEYFALAGFDNLAELLPGHGAGATGRGAIGDRLVARLALTISAAVLALEQFGFAGRNAQDHREIAGDIVSA